VRLCCRILFHTLVILSILTIGRLIKLEIHYFSMMTKKHTLKNLSHYFPALMSASSQDRSRYCFDNAATACTLEPAIAAMKHFYETAHGSVHRGIYAPAEHTTQLYEDVRIAAATFIGAQHASEIIFTSGATDSLNTVAYVWARHILEPGDGIIITQAEHHAHYVLWHQIAQECKAHVYVLPIDPRTFCVDLSGLSHVLTKSIKVVAVTMSSNVLGPIWGRDGVLLDQLIKHARAAGAGIVLDAAQAVAHTRLAVNQLDCDFLAFSVHKMGGPTGLGVLYARSRMHPVMKPYRFGGGMVAAVASDFMTWQSPPHCFEAGTPPIAQVVGFGAVLEFYKKHVEFDALVEHEAALCAQLIEGLSAIPGVTVVGNTELLSRHGHVVSWYVDGIHAHDIAATLSDYGCDLRAGDHCAHPLSEVWGKRATVRASFFMYTLPSDVAYLIEAVAKTVKAWRALV
jgi:cysteine desulfurase/selenocysteine lyase